MTAPRNVTTEMMTRLALLLMVLIAPLAAQSNKKVDFAKDVFPILERNCVECHRATYVDENGRRRRPKGRVMLDTLANIQKSKRGKLFYGCSAFPDCSFVTWKKPVDKPCPACGASYLVERMTKKAGHQFLCDSENCDHIESAEG